MGLHAERTGEVVSERYRLDRAIGRGGMGAVYAATQLGLGRRVAVKLLLPQFASEPDLLERFRREALAAASLQHPNIVQVIDFGRASDGTPFLVMELLDGAPLTRLLTTHGALPWPRVAALAVQLLGALGAAHAAGIVHRDIKPDNVFVVPLPGVGELVKLLDFGIAKLTDGVTYRKLTDTGLVLGTPTYMAPEQMLGERVDARADLYAVGVILYCLLAGRRPFRGDDPAALLRAVLDGAAEPLARLCPTLPPPVVALVERAMARLPDARFQTADEMRAAVTALGAQAVEHATRNMRAPLPAPPAQRPAPPRRLRRLYRAALGLVAFVLLALVGLYILGTESDPGAPATPTTRPAPPADGAISAPATNAIFVPLAMVPETIDANVSAQLPGLGTFSSGRVAMVVTGLNVSSGYSSAPGIGDVVRVGMQYAVDCSARQGVDVRALPERLSVTLATNAGGVIVVPFTVEPVGVPEVVVGCLRTGLAVLRMPPPQGCINLALTADGICGAVKINVRVPRDRAR